MNTTLDINHDEAKEAAESPHIRQYHLLRGRAIMQLEAQMREQATASISKTLSLGDTAPKTTKPSYLKLVTPQVEIDYIRSLADKDDATRQAWMDKYVSDEVSTTMKRLARSETVSPLVVGEALAAGLVNPAYMPDGELGPLFATMAKRYNRENFFKNSIITARKNGLISQNMTVEQAEKALWDIYSHITI